MPYYGSNTGEEFGTGATATANTGHANVQNLAPPSQYDTGYQAMERDAGSYQPGSFPKLMDQVEEGSDSES